MTPNPHDPDLRLSFESAWDTFTTEVGTIAANVRNRAGSGQPVHDMLKALYDVPYYRAKQLVLPTAGGQSRMNPGPLAGLFFERFVGEAVVGFLQSRLPEVCFFVNKSSPSYRTLGQLPRDPDLCVEYNGRRVVFEMKTSPKLGDLQYAVGLQQRHLELDTPYLLIGGEVSANQALISRLVETGWVAFLDAKPRNMRYIAGATVDRLLEKAASWLAASESIDEVPVR